VSQPSAGSDPRAWLTSLEHFGIKLGLRSIHAICASLGHPERQLRSVHIAGTNGKGSVAAMVDESLRAAGHRVGRYTSPHLVRLEERITVTGEPVSAVTLDAAIAAVRRTVEGLRADGSLEAHPTFFEVLTAAAFVVFARAGVEVAVLEVGLGGRFDATNIVEPMVAAITSVALDHEQHLGTTLEAIALEKAGIIKPGATVIAGPLPDEALRVVRQTCDERGATLHNAWAECTVTRTREQGRTVLHLTTPRRVYPRLVLALRGEHQVQNATVAVRLLETLDCRGVSVGETAILDGVAGARWPARLDLVEAGGGRQVLVDGAHNPAGAAALAAYIQSEWPAGLPIVFGAMRDKDVAGMLQPLGSLARPLILTTAPGIRAAAAEDLAAVARAQWVADLLVCPDVDEALTAAWARAPRIAAAGSLYLAGRVLTLLASRS
jgi:dihydrofolate synthase/folylpolyglutamate synthase